MALRQLRQHLYPIGRRSFAIASAETQRPISLETIDAQSAEGKAKTLIRSSTHVLREVLTSDNIPSLILLDGPKGVGKSTLLSQSVAFARKHHHVVLHIPSAREWTGGAGFFTAKPVEGMEPHLDGLEAVRFYDRPSQTRKLFEDLLNAHAEILEEMPCHEKLCTPLTKECKSLRELVQLGLDLLVDIDTDWGSHPTEAGDVLHQLILQLAHTDRPVGIAIDDFHAFVGLTCMTNERHHRLHANCIRVIAQHFGRERIEATAKALRKGYVMLATDSDAPMETWRKSRVRSVVDFPLAEEVRNDPAGKQWWHDFRDRVRKADQSDSLYVQVPELQGGELKALCATFEQGGLKRDHGRAYTDRLIALAGGRADKMRKIFISR
ncbi:hypothetical protein BWQ96_05090 [Gracilariopsis chorda]|uniref:Small ribosomal subunit protein mS29 n=1 Tax=Gracilariopsis chorda TaxID=448386 RepID=A0A2V3ISW0_9FLOR|nr:hypothetical protein BWQ96_05090 [Gracilariopsis chorda]|eukprot:PXF45189.1 hypothetical protein BWQ96_05090 [Gracilariopsis chorda]